MTDRMIRRFVLEGEISDKNVEQTKHSLYKEMVAGMKDEGFLPILDLDEVFAMSFDPMKQVFHFRYVIQGAYTGKEAAWRGSGIVNNKVIPIQTTKLPQS